MNTCSDNTVVFFKKNKKQTTVNNRFIDKNLFINIISDAGLKDANTC